MHSWSRLSFESSTVLRVKSGGFEWREHGGFHTSDVGCVMSSL